MRFDKSILHLPWYKLYLSYLQWATTKKVVARCIWWQRILRRELISVREHFEWRNDVPPRRTGATKELNPVGQPVDGRCILQQTPTHERLWDKQGNEHLVQRRSDSHQHGWRSERMQHHMVQPKGDRKHPVVVSSREVTPCDVRQRSVESVCGTQQWC